MKLLAYRYLPVNIFLIYTIFVYAALFFGPIKYVEMDYLAVILFCSVFAIMMLLGFIKGVSGSFHVEPEPLGKKSEKLINFIIILSVIIAFKLWGQFILSGRSLSLASMGDNYVSSYDGYTRGQASIGFSYIFAIFEQTLTTICLLVTFSHFGTLKKNIKIMALFVVLTYLLVNVIGSGKQKYLGDVLIFLSYSYLIKMSIFRRKIGINKFIGYTALISVFICLFSFILNSRYSAIGINSGNISDSLHPLIVWDSGSILFDVFGEELAFPIGMFLGYFSNGLYGLSLSLHMDFEWTYLVGNSYSLSRIIEVVISSPGLILANSYPFRAEELGWGLDKWHSAFSWFASDVSFPGVIVLGAFFGFFYGRIWKGAQSNRNAFSKPIFIYLSLGAVFIYSNNQMFHSLSGVFTFVILISLYFLSRKPLKLF
ncbi:putative oligosaccharide repeat unit polymerase [Vibrio cholerae]|nr:oligosaccharide repeat unit polymerase [Vibrio cholerae]BCN19606.1 putative O-antigen polymerase [Vibrio cholerae]BCN21382.1 putative O-antigen polymerase [Vibrio cholerae]GHX12376.1 putative oligosaccharide repeat unit polymerase [Vibrio cholerae]GHY77453.1 putative oligosaccharide repeat unit polymerase [Vibrio cholerae]